MINRNKRDREMENDIDIDYKNEKIDNFFSKYLLFSLLLGFLGCLCVLYINKKICSLGGDPDFGSILDRGSLIVFSPDKNLSFNLEIKKDLATNGVSFNRTKIISMTPTILSEYNSSGQKND